MLGHPGLNLPSIDPLFIDSIDMDQTKAGAFSITTSFRNASVLGLSKGKFTAMK